jgi:hypothetical protein
MLIPNLFKNFEEDKSEQTYKSILENVMLMSSLLENFREDKSEVKVSKTN